MGIYDHMHSIIVFRHNGSLVKFKSHIPWYTRRNNWMEMDYVLY